MLKKPSLLKKIGWVLLAIGLLGIGYGIYRLTPLGNAPTRSQNREKKTAKVERGSLTLTVVANGTVQPDKSVNVSPKNSGLLKALYVQEGDQVKAGQLLAQMDNNQLMAQLAQAQAQRAAAQATLQKLQAGNRPQDIAQAKAQLDDTAANLQKLQTGNRPQDIAQAKARLESAQSTLQQAIADFKRNQALQQEGAISQQALDTARTQRDTAQAQLDQAQEAYQLSRAGSRPEDIASANAQVQQRQAALSLLQAGSRPEDIAQAQAQVAAAQAAVQIVQTQVNDTQIRAPFSGIVTRKFAEPGAFVAPTTSGSSVSSATSSSILSLASTNQVVANVAETDIARIRLGQKATLTADAYPKQTFDGKVIQVSPQALVQQNVTSFEVTLSIDNDPKQLLRSGMNTSLTFQVDKLENVLLIPTVAIVRQPEGTGVYILKDKEPQFVPIETGSSAGTQTEVISGLEEGQRILLSFPPGTRPTNLPRGMQPGLPLPQR